MHIAYRKNICKGDIFMEKNYLNLQQIHEEQKNMLKELDEFCKKENITYFVCGGTLLGAIRHKGFIPWDDDVDVFMPRPDYEKFHEVLKKYNYHINDKLFFSSFKYENLLLPYGKLMNSDFKMETHYYENEYDNYLWIDIFPMDGLPKSDKETKKIYKKILFLRRILNLVEVKDEVIENESKKRWMVIPKKIARYFLSKKIIIKKIIKMMDNISKKIDFNTAQYVGGIVWGYGPQEKLLKSEVNETEVEFEGLKVKGLSCYDKYLSNLYGDYMTLPPIEKRITHQIKIYRSDEVNKD